MSPVHAPRDGTYDVVVIGSGLGGLTAAALSAREGKRVLVVEQAGRLGGYAQGFRRGSYLFDAGIHGTSFGWIEPTLPNLLEQMGVGDRVQFAECGEPLYTVFLPGLRFDAPNGAEAFLAAHAAACPDDAEPLARLYKVMQDITEELTRPRPDATLRSLTEAERRFDSLLRYRMSTLAEVLDEFSCSERLGSLIAAPWVNLGLPPSRLSFISWAALTVVRTETGEHYCLGSFESLVQALAHAVGSNGGKIALATPARRILLDDGRVAGVELADGSRLRTGAVVSNADAKQTFEDLVGLEQLPANFVQRLSRLRPSLSAFVLYAATAMPREAVDLPHISYVHDSWDHEESHARMEAGELASLMVTVPTLTDPSLAPPGKQLVNCVALVGAGAAESWAESKGRYVELLLERIDQIMPGFRANLTFAEAATPVAFEQRSWNQGGAVYGWENTPQQVGSKRLSSATPVEGLYLASQWAQPGTGSLATIYSGVRAANLVLGRPAEHLGPVT
jgi:phytoene desaturase